MTNSARMFLRSHQRSKDGMDHTYWSLVETVRTASGPRQRTVGYWGELNGSAQARWLNSVEVFNEQGEAQQLKLFPSHVEVPDDDPQVARVLVNRVRLERTRQCGACFLGWELWKHLELDRFFELFSVRIQFGEAQVSGFGYFDFRVTARPRRVHGSDDTLYMQAQYWPLRIAQHDESDCADG